MMHWTMIAMSVIAAAGGAPPRGQERWEPLGTQHGVALWGRALPGSPLREIKAEAHFAAPPARVWQALRDVERASEFLPAVVMAQVVATASPRDRLEYWRWDSPSLGARDAVLQVSVVEDPASETFYQRWRAAPPGTLPAAEGIERLAICAGSWVVEPLEGGGSHVVYWSAIDPGDSTPSWLTNAAQLHDVPMLMDALAHRAQDPRWTP
jgi:hypothetical protein